MKVITLDQSYATEYRILRLKALKENPEAFGSSFEEESRMPLSFTEERLNQKESMTFGVFDFELVGIVTLTFSLRKKLKHNGHIQALYVDETKRGKGYGKVLLKHVIEVAKSLQMINLFLMVTSTNQKAIHLYESLGFMKYGTERREIYYEGNYYDSDLMALYIEH